MSKRDASDAFGGRDALPPDLTATTLQHFVDAHSAPCAVDVEKLKDEAGSTVPALSPERLAAFQNAVVQRAAVCVLLAAGQGSRFKADFPKVVHPFDGKPLAQHAIDAAVSERIPVVVIIGHARKQVVQTLKLPADGSVIYVCQEDQMGTGHAVYLAKYMLPQSFAGHIIVSYADNPNVDGALLKQLLDNHLAQIDKHGNDFGAIILTGSRACAGQGAANYGRIVRKTKEGGPVIDIIEKKTIMAMAKREENLEHGAVSWTADELDGIDEFNSGIVVARATPYLDVLGQIVASQTKLDPPKFEYYATDFVKGLVARGMIAEGYKVPVESMWKLEGANTVEELHELEKKLEGRRLRADDTNLQGNNHGNGKNPSIEIHQ